MYSGTTANMQDMQDGASVDAPWRDFQGSNKGASGRWWSVGRSSRSGPDSAAGGGGSGGVNFGVTSGNVGEVTVTGGGRDQAHSGGEGGKPGERQK